MLIHEFMNESSSPFLLDYEVTTYNIIKEKKK